MKNLNRNKEKQNDTGDTPLGNSQRNFGNLTPKFCENCGAPYNDLDYKIVHENPVATVLLFHCNNCNNSYLVNIIKPAGIASRVGINTDLGSNDDLGRYIGKFVTADQVIDIYNYFEHLEDPDDFFSEIEKYFK